MRCPQSRACHRPVAAILFVVAMVAAGAIPADAQSPASYLPPVDAPVSDAFRRPANPYAAGNRGIDYGTAPGSDVAAAAPGEVSFAGQVGGRLHVVVLHSNGIRTSYSFLASVAVRRGQRVDQGDVVGTSGPTLHFGARAGKRYLDPAALLAGAAVEVRLIPVEERSPQTEATERDWLRRSLAGVGAAAGKAGAAAAWLAGRAGDAAVGVVRGSVERPVLVASTVLAATRGYLALAADQRGCTPASIPPPEPTDQRRIAVLVGGFGSGDDDAAVLDVDTARLGYDGADRVLFSYAGGRAPGVGALSGVATSRYGPVESSGDLRVAGRRLRALLAGIGRAHPDVPVDVIAHSQGGVVARLALAGPDAGLPVEHLVTLGSPHGGALVAVLAGELGLDDDASPLGKGLSAVTGDTVDPAAPAVAQLAEGSSLLRALASRPLPSRVALTSIATPDDVTVPGLSSVVDGATNVFTNWDSGIGHGGLPGSPEGQREVALALSGMGPTCHTGDDLLTGVVVAAAMRAIVRDVGANAGPALRFADDVAEAVLDLVAAAT